MSKNFKSSSYHYKPSYYFEVFPGETDYLYHCVMCGQKIVGGANAPAAKGRKGDVIMTCVDGHVVRVGFKGNGLERAAGRLKAKEK